MPGNFKSQWEFGELFPPEATRQVLTVSDLTSQIKRLLETRIGQVWVTGEVTNFRAQSSGHLYFTLKDAESQVSCVLFRNEARESRGLVADGRKLIVRGELTVYEPRGQYQLRVTAVEPQGLGALQLAFEKLKQKLGAEGLFATERKRPLPRYPRRVGIVTSPTGAAIRDVLHTIRRRHPGLELVLAPCRVQGQGAAAEIAAAIRLLNELGGRQRSALGESSPSSDRGLDLILVTRGGGSLEDLWAFNEEVVARAIFESALPVVSAVGHEIDFTISDFVADLRAATPTAAAEIITQGYVACAEFVAEVSSRMLQSCRRQTADRRRALEKILGRLERAHPRRRLEDWLQRLDDLTSGLTRCAGQGLRDRQNKLGNLRDRLLRLRPRSVLERKAELLLQVQRRLGDLARGQLKNAGHRLVTLEARLRLLGPEQVLSRGYSVTMDAATGGILRSARQVRAGQNLRTKLHQGEVRSKAEGTDPEPGAG